MAQKRILCFGDSNTWGYIPGKNGLVRYDEQTRWTSLLQEKMGDAYKILDFGLCGCESGAKVKNKCFNADAQTLFPSVLCASLPVDAVFIMLGTNDLKKVNNWQSGDTAKNLDMLINVTHTLSPGARIFLAPAVILKSGLSNDIEFDESALEKSKLCAQEVAELAKRRDIPLFDTNQFVHELDFDGCHFTATDHKAFAEGFAEFLKAHLQ